MQSAAVTAGNWGQCRKLGSEYYFIRGRPKGVNRSSEIALGPHWLLDPTGYFWSLAPWSLTRAVSKDMR